MIAAGLLAVIAQEANRVSINVAELFSAQLYTTSSSAQNYVNGVDLATYGGFIWTRPRSVADYHAFFDNKRGITEYLLPLSNAGSGIDANYVQSFNSNGYSIKAGQPAGVTMVGYTHRIAPRFLDIVTYTGTGAARDITHSLGVAPGMVIVKKRNAAAHWRVYHRSLGATQRLELSNTVGMVSSPTADWNGTAPTASVFSLGTDTAVNNLSDTYVAYVFAHDPTGVIQCGSYTGNGSASGPVVNLGWQPQYLMIKRADNTSDWNVMDTARTFAGADDNIVTLNLLSVESTAAVANPSSSGFTINSTSSAFNANGGTYIYMAIKAAT